MWARIENNTVMEVTDISPKGRFHPSLIWKSCNKDVMCGWIYEDGSFSAPPVVEEISTDEQTET